MYRREGIMVILGGFGPAIAAVLVALFSGGGVALRDYVKKAFQFRVSWRMYAFAIVLPPAIYLCATLLFRVLGGTFPEVPDDAPSLWTYPLLLIVISLIGGGQEELGWRGFALPMMQKRWSPLVSAVILGLLWALWHLPLFLAPQAAQSSLPPVWYVANAVGLSVIMTWHYNALGGSAVLAFMGVPTCLLPGIL